MPADFRGHEADEARGQRRDYRRPLDDFSLPCPPRLPPCLITAPMYHAALVYDVDARRLAFLARACAAGAIDYGRMLCRCDMPRSASTLRQRRQTSEAKSPRTLARFLLR